MDDLNIGKIIIKVDNSNKCAKATKKNSKFIFILKANHYLTKIFKNGKSFLVFFIKWENSSDIFIKRAYIFSGLTILGINKTPKIKSINGAIITKNDSIVIKFLKLFI